MTMTPIAGLAAALTLMAFGAAQAQDAPPAGGDHPHGRGVVRQACSGDIAKFCSDVHAGGGRVMEYFKAHKDDLSDGCKAAIAQMRAAHRAEKAEDATPH